MQSLFGQFLIKEINKFVDKMKKNCDGKSISFSEQERDELQRALEQLVALSLDVLYPVVVLDERIDCPKHYILNNICVIIDELEEHFEERPPRRFNNE